MRHINSIYVNDVPGFPPRLTVRTIELPREPELLGILPTAHPLAWVRHGQGLVGWGTAARLNLPAETDTAPGRPGQRFADARRWFADLLAGARIEDAVGLPGTGPVAFASFTFDPASAESVLIVPRILVGRRDGRAWLTTVTEGEPAAEDTVLPRVAEPAPIGTLHWSVGTLGPHRWATAVATAVRRIQVGELDKVVLARDLRAHAGADIDTRTVLSRLAGDFADCYTFSVAGLVGATPELLLRRDTTAETGTFPGDSPADTVASLVLAGTRSRGATHVEDEKLAEELCFSIKDAEEHRYAVDSLRETLAPLCSHIDVPSRPELLRLRNVQHLASPVQARLRAGISTLDVVAALHPTAAVGGTPTARAMGLIRELEGMDRGRYAGPVGWMDAHGAGEWGIALRSAMIDGSEARLFAGCGIVAGSDPEAELAEASSKFRVMRGALTD